MAEPDLQTRTPPVESDAPTVSGGRLVSALVRDQHRHWGQGDPVPVESYLRHHPNLRDDPEAVLDLIYNEWAIREGLGEELRIEEYVERFPDLANSLRMQWEVHAVCRAARREASPSTASFTGPPPLSDSDAHRRVATNLIDIPGYQVSSILGRGGMGIVYKARHLGLNRLVALKMPRAGVDADPGELIRFRREAEAAASLQHPNLVQIHDVGVWQPDPNGDAFPYLSMEFVDGGNLHGRLSEGSLAPREAAALIETLARAMHYAHQRGIIHRDLKPANVLLPFSREPPASAPETLAGGSRLNEAMPKITDFGLAKRLDDDAGQTRTGAVMGTPSYMAPEQAEGRIREIGPATDVYALGAVLYETLTGRPPFKGTTVLDTLEQVRFLEPVALRRFQPKTPRDLETICLKCLAKGPRKRYPSAEALADDLRRFLDGKPILARPTRVWEHGWKAAKRRPGVTALIGLVLAVAISGFVGVLGQWWRAERAAEEQRKIAHTFGINLTQQFLERDNTPRAQEVLDSLTPQPGQTDLRGFEWYYLYGVCHGESHSLPGGECVAFSLDGRFIASAGDKGTVKVWDVTGREIATLNGHMDVVTAVAFSLDGKLLASTAKDKTVRLWDWQGQKESVALATEHTGTPLCLAFSPDGKSLGSTGRDGMVVVWDLVTGKKRQALRLPEGSGVSLAFNPNGARLAVAGTDERVWFWDWKTAEKMVRLENDYVAAVGLTFGPDGRLLATAGSDRTIKLWDMTADEPGKKPFATLTGHNGRVACVAFDATGKRLASGSWDRTIRVWDVPSGSDSAVPAPVVLRGHTGFVTALAFDREGRHLVSAGSDRAVKLWDLQAERADVQLPGGRKQLTCLAYSPDGRTLATGSQDHKVNLYDARTKELLFALAGHGKPVQAVAFNHEGDLIASASEDKTVRLWDVTSRQLQHTLEGHSSGVNCVAFAQDGQLLVSGGTDGTIKLWDVRTGHESSTLRGHDGSVHGVAFSPNDKRLASVGEDATLRIWYVARAHLSEPVLLHGHSAAVVSVAFSADGKYLATGGKDRTVIVWDVAKNQSLFRLSGHDGIVVALAFHPMDTRRLASVASDKVVKLWDLDTRREMLTLPGCLFETTGLAFRPDGEELAAVGGSGRFGQIKLWSATPGRNATGKRP